MKGPRVAPSLNGRALVREHGRFRLSPEPSKHKHGHSPASAELDRLVSRWHIGSPQLGFV